jgi:hypothetical protein
MATEQKLERLNIYNNGKLIGQDYQRDNGYWSHKWYDPKTKKFERGSWTGRAKGENMSNWIYEPVNDTN